MKTLAICIILSQFFPAFLEDPGIKTVNEPEYILKIKFRTTVNGQPLKFDSTYTNSFGEDFTVTAFRFYVGHLVAGSTGDGLKNSKSIYHLVDAAVLSSQIISIPLKVRELLSLNFQVGVDSIDNVSGAQDGDLDPAKGMFWTWNSGYVMAKLEGNSTYSKVPTGSFTYHIGGYKGPDKAIRRIELSVSKEISDAVLQKQINEIVIEVELGKWFESIHSLKISDKAFVHGPGATARLYADNYSTMFSVAKKMDK